MSNLRYAVIVLQGSSNAYNPLRLAISQSDIEHERRSDTKIRWTILIKPLHMVHLLWED